MMINETLLRLVPPVFRVRDFRLYTRQGRRSGSQDGRLVDLWQCGGEAILGHTPPGMLGSLKNTAARGLFAPLPHPQENRLIKALSSLLPNRTFRLYGSEASLCRALAAAGFPLLNPFPDPALSPAETSEPTPNPEALPPAPVLWRPFLDTLPPDRPLIPVLPLPWPGALRVLALPLAAASLAGPAALPEAPSRFPPPERPATASINTLPAELLSPVILAAATRCVYDLIAANPSRGRVHYPRIEAALVKSPWRRRGIYLYPRDTPDDKAYAGIFRQFLEQGFLLPPSQDQPLILPGILSPGEEAKLAELLRAGTAIKAVKRMPSE